MNEIAQFSLQFFAIISGLALMVHVIRTSPWTSRHGGLAVRNWSLWLAEQIQSRAGISHESFLARLARLSSLTTKYGVAAWTVFYPQYLSLNFWVLVWVLLLVLEVLRKSAQFYMPARWEDVSLKLDSEHFWLIHLIILGTAEVELGGGPPWGIISLIIFYIMFAGESRPSVLAALEDVASCGWAVSAIFFLTTKGFTSLGDFAAVMTIVVSVRGIVRVLLGRAWIRRRFWWIAQFCLMTALIIKSLVVLNVLAFFNT
jgi:hypothetical protein